jgi:cytochrome c oxidase assembly protein subunit 15
MEVFFVRWAKVTLVAIFLIIVAGGVVRTTESGMGCPDWPKCFGQWIPPTDASELPENYAEIYAEKYGYTDTTFNVFHTWTEYVNRLIGFLAGNFCLVLFVLAIVYYWRKKKDGWLISLTLLLVALMGFQAWLGAKVVYSELNVNKITIHMVMAMFIVALLLFILARAQRLIKTVNFSKDKMFFWLLIVAIVISFVQVILGTQVRQEIDTISEAMHDLGRSSWIAQLSGVFKFHRTFAILVLAVNGALIYRNWKSKLGHGLVKWLIPVLAIEALSGVVMVYLDVPAAMQPVHLVLANLMFAVQAYVLMRYLVFKPSGELV